MVARMCHGVQVGGKLKESILAVYHRLLGIELGSSDLASSTFTLSHLPSPASKISEGRGLREG